MKPSRNDGNEASLPPAFTDGFMSDFSLSEQCAPWLDTLGLHVKHAFFQTSDESDQLEILESLYMERKNAEAPLEPLWLDAYNNLYRNIVEKGPIPKPAHGQATIETYPAIEEGMVKTLAEQGLTLDEAGELEIQLQGMEDEWDYTNLIPALYFLARAKAHGENIDSMDFNNRLEDWLDEPQMDDAALIEWAERYAGFYVALETAQTFRETDEWRSFHEAFGLTEEADKETYYSALDVALAEVAPHFANEEAREELTIQLRNDPQRPEHLALLAVMTAIGAREADHPFTAMAKTVSEIEAQHANTINDLTSQLDAQTDEIAELKECAAQGNHAVHTENADLKHLLEEMQSRLERQTAYFSEQAAADALRIRHLELALEARPNPLATGGLLPKPSESAGWNRHLTNRQTCNPGSVSSTSTDLGKSA